MQGNVLESIVSTIVAAQYPTASSDQRNAAAHALTQVHTTILFTFALSPVSSALLHDAPLQLMYVGRGVPLQVSSESLCLRRPV